MPRIDAFLKKVNDMGGSDLHIESGVPPKIRLHGKLMNLDDQVMEPERLSEIIEDFLNERQKGIYHKLVKIQTELTRLEVG